MRLFSNISRKDKRTRKQRKQHYHDDFGAIGINFIDFHLVPPPQIAKNIEAERCTCLLCKKCKLEELSWRKEECFSKYRRGF